MKNGAASDGGIWHILEKRASRVIELLQNFCWLNGDEKRFLEMRFWYSLELRSSALMIPFFML